MPSTSQLLLDAGVWLLAASLASASPLHLPIAPNSKRAFGSLNNATCIWDPTTINAWTDSGANNMLADWLQSHNDGSQTDWLNNMDKTYHIIDGDSGLDCNTIYTNACNAPDTACSTWSNQPYYYFRFMAANTVSMFRYAHESLQDTTITNLASIGQMLQDFKGTVPDATQLALLFGNLASGAGFFSIFIGLAGISGVGSIFSLLGGVFTIVSRYTKTPTIPDYDAIEAAVEQYAGDIFTSAQTYLDDLLPALWGAGNETMLDELYDVMIQGGMTQPATSYTYSIQSLLDNGQMMVPVESSAIASGIKSAIGSLQVSVLGNTLAALRYFVLSVIGGDETSCLMTYGAQWITGITDHNNMDGLGAACHYLLQLPVGSNTAITVSQDLIDKAVGYGMDMVGMFNNVRQCDNADPSTRSQAPFVSTTGNVYPPCYFGIAYVDGAGSLSDPILEPANTPPSWITDNADLWNDAQLSFCKEGDNDKAPACKAASA